MITDSDPKTKYQLKTVKNFLLSKFKSELFKKRDIFSNFFTSNLFIKFQYKSKQILKKQSFTEKSKLEIINFTQDISFILKPSAVLGYCCELDSPFYNWRITRSYGNAWQTVYMFIVTQKLHFSTVLSIHLILMRIRIWILDPHWKRMDPDPKSDPCNFLRFTEF